MRKRADLAAMAKVRDDHALKTEPSIPGVPVLRAESIGKCYGSAVAIANVDLELRSGAVTGLIGRNGAGKTTLLRILAGALTPSNGRVWRKSRQHIGLALDKELALYSDMPVVSYLTHMNELGPGRRTAPGPVEVMDWLGLQSRRRQEIRTLSRGYRQRVLLAQAFLGAPEVLLLDEPLNSLDPAQIIEVSRLVRQLPWRPAVLVSSHVVSHVVDMADDIAVMAAGKLVAHGPLADFFGPHQDGPGVAIAVAASERDVRAALDGFRIEQLTTRGGVARALIQAVGTDPLTPDYLTAEVSSRLAAAGLPIVEVLPRHLQLAEFV